MKMFMLAVLGCLTMTVSSFVWAGACYGNCGGEAGVCNPIESNCQCTDPMCNRPQYSDCISRAYCCEAFGNIGGR